MEEAHLAACASRFFLPSVVSFRGRPKKSAKMAVSQSVAHFTFVRKASVYSRQSFTVRYRYRTAAVEATLGRLI